VPLLFDHSLRLAGIILPAGMILGLILYVTVDLLLTPPTATAPETTPADGTSGGGRRQLLILALFAAVIAHFVEIHFGIAIASTLTTFWVMAGALVAVGLGWVNLAGESVATAVPAGETAGPAGGLNRLPEASAPVVVANAAPASAGRSKSRATAQTSASRPGAPSSTRRPAERAAVAARPAPQPSSRPRSPVLTFLPYAGIGALITLVLTWDYLINQTGAQGASNILWNAFTTRIDNTTFRIVQSPMLLMLMAFTWLVGGLLALTEHLQMAPARRGADGLSRRAAAKRAVIYAGVVVGVWLIYGLFHAGRLSVQGFSGLAVFGHVASHILVFDIVLFILMLLVGAAIWAGDTRPRSARFSQDLPAIPLVAGAGAALVALVVIVNVNIKTVQADTYYKQGLAYEGAGAWDGAVVLHGEAAKLEPAEDFYYLFLGRALLQLAAGQPVGNAVLPTDTTKLSQEALLGVIERGVRARNREDLMRASYAALSGAQRLNPYNTDHSANLARHNRSWAFTDALGPNDAPTNALLRQLATTQAKGVNFDRLAQSLAYYRQATSLSPQNAQLWNELATTQFIMGDTEAALATLRHSETLDPIYSQTFIIRGDMLATIGDKAGALAAYRKGVDLAGADPGILSAVGVYSAQTGDNDGALVAFKRMAELQEASLTATQQQLNELNALVSRLGGYGALLPTATQRRDALQGSLPGIRAQLHLTYRNLALVQRDAGRIPEALQMARTALTYASEAERPTIDALIAELQKGAGG
ncbi:MAG: hypothetical protein QG637_1394, partial [Chloroflexota bacterium]|nr:hypothetical protein [Chloroflexota bacterium]